MKAFSQRFNIGLWKIAWRYLVIHRWQSALMVLGIALGVAVVVAIDLANASARSAFELSAETLTGKATHQISGSSQGVAEELYVRLRTENAAELATPRIQAFVTSPDLGDQAFQLTGIDPFSDGPFRTYLGDQGELPVAELGAFLTRPGAILISRQVADRFSLAAGDMIQIEAGGLKQEAFVAGILEPADDLARRSLEGTLLGDISTVQELTGREGWLDRIDLILSEDAAVQLDSWLPAGAVLALVAARGGSVAEMTAAFRLNLQALSLLALVVGLFLIYNTMTFAVVQRRALFGALRCLGVIRREIFSLVLVEAAVVGILGSLIGIGLGILLSRQTVAAVSQTINDLYFTTTVQAVTISWVSLLKGGLLGVAATIIAAYVPAREAATIPPQAALQRSGLESKARQASVWAAAAGVLAAAAGAALFLYPSDSLFFGFTGTFAVVIGFALISAFALVLMMRLLAPLTSRLFGLIGRLAPRSLVNTLSRTSVAVAALMVAVAVSIGVGLMIASFRYTVILWLQATLQGDVYISAPAFSGTTPSASIDPQIVDLVSTWPGVRRADVLRSTVLQSRQGPVNVAATSNILIGGERLFMSRSVDADEAWQGMEDGMVLISEPLARRLDLLTPGSEIELLTPNGWKAYPIFAVFYDYASSQGSLLMARDVFTSDFADQTITSIALRLEPGADPDIISTQLSQAAAGVQRILVRPNAALRGDVLEIFDRTFAITAALRILATLVAFIGVLNTLMLLQLEKGRELGVLRALGLTGRQLWRLTMLETGLMGLAAGILAVPTGYALALILVYIINQRSFGWTLQTAFPPEAFLQAILVALLAALAAGVYPALRLSRMEAADVIRYE